MFVERLIATDALERIKAATECGDRVLGVDGFRVVPGGLAAPLNLILDLSVKPMTRELAAAEAAEFVALHGADDVVFEVVVDPNVDGS